MKKFTLLALSAGLLSVLALSACGNKEEKQEAATLSQLPVEVVYRERMMLPPNALVTVTLEDVSLMDVAATLIDKQTSSTQGGPPFRFTMKYDESKIDPRMRYALRARIELDGKLLFTNTSSIPAFENTDGKPVQILVQNVARPEAPQAQKPALLGNSNWQVTRIGATEVPKNAQNRALNLNFQDGRASGFSGCNQFNGQYTLEALSLKFSPLASTRMACIEGTAMATEQMFLAALTKVDAYSLKGGKLLLIGNNLPLMELQAQ